MFDYYIFSSELQSECIASENTCPVCHHEVDNIIQHIASCGLVEYKCLICDKSFNCYKARRNHQLTCRQEEAGSAGNGSDLSIS